MTLARTVWALAAISSIAMLASPLRGAPMLIHNRSPSAPVGFYLRVNHPPAIGDFVTLVPPASARAYAARRGFGDRTDRFLKRVVANAGDVVCAAGDEVVVAGARLPRLRVDTGGHRLPRWEGCRRLARDEVFLAGLGDASFDGRYWGPTRLTELDAVWRPIVASPSLDSDSSS